MAAHKNIPIPPRPRPYNQTTVRPRPIPSLAPRDEWEHLSVDDLDVKVEEHSQIRVCVVRDDEIALPVITEWLDLDLPLPPQRPRPL